MCFCLYVMELLHLSEWLPAHPHEKQAKIATEVREEMDQVIERRRAMQLAVEDCQVRHHFFVVQNPQHKN
jgi:hypothetical protein